MNIQSAAQKDIRREKPSTGAYEWWYFDATSDDGTTELVIIFYEGNPFSRRYIQLQKQGGYAKADNFPAISISLYQNQEPIYYSFTEVKPGDAFFNPDAPGLQIGNHFMELKANDEHLVYDITLQETLPSGDSIDAELTFKSPIRTSQLDVEGNNTTLHMWHLIQPRASVDGRISCCLTDKGDMEINFTGEGYHDHNIGREPLKNEFEEWYWGRFHFKNFLFIYYLTGNNEANNINNGWLLERNGQSVLEALHQVAITDYSYSLYGLKTGRKITFRSADSEVIIQQSALLDNGPFYQRFSSEAFLTIPGQKIAASCQGLSEYLNPPKIYNRLFWPLANMRIRYKKESPHWVQRSGMLYRWTW